MGEWNRWMYKLMIFFSRIVFLEWGKYYDWGNCENLLNWGVEV